MHKGDGVFRGAKWPSHRGNTLNNYFIVRPDCGYYFKTEIIEKGKLNVHYFNSFAQEKVPHICKNFEL